MCALCVLVVTPALLLKAASCGLDQGLTWLMLVGGIVVLCAQLCVPVMACYV